MDLPKDKEQTDYQVVSVFGISAVFATLDTEGTANLRDTPNPTPLLHPYHQEANWKDRAHKLKYAPMGEHVFQGNRHLSCFQGTAECCSRGNPWGTLHRTQRTQGQIFSCQGSLTYVCLGVRGKRLK